MTFQLYKILLILVLLNCFQKLVYAYSDADCLTPGKYYTGMWGTPCIGEGTCWILKSSTSTSNPAPSQYVDATPYDGGQWSAWLFACMLSSPTQLGCTNGKYKSGSSCLSCNSRCSQCVTSSTNCIVCAVNRSTIPTCNCSTGYYGTTSCSACNSKCNGCTSSTACTACYSTTRLASNLCACKDGYYETGATTCPACVSPCKNCTSATLCTTCIDTTKSPPNCTGTTCGNGFFGPSPCTACQYKCGTCTNATSCTTCANSTRDLSLACACKTQGFWDEGNTICASCASTYCLTCSNATSCNTCSDSTRDPTKSCACKDGFYDNGTPTCLPCGYKCSLCSNATSCTTCYDITRTNAPVCSCASGYFETGYSSCSQCQTTCLQCNNLSSCISCVDITTRDLSQNCACIANHFEKGTAACGQCNQIKCASCNNTTSCTSCSHSNRKLTSNCSCQLGFYENDTPQCAQCLSICATCSNNSSCDTCFHSSQDSSLNCGCAQGLYADSNGYCQICDVSCINGCETTATNCLGACVDANMIHPACNTCLDGFYKDSATSCKNCIYPCNTCTSLTSCLTCSDSISRDSTKNCECSSSYYKTSSNSCETCNVACNQCTTSSRNCTTCSNITRSNPPDCLCKDGYYFDGQAVCPPCSALCFSCCQAANNCTKCTNPQKVPPHCIEDVIVEETTPICVSGQYLNQNTNTCQQCSVNFCETCNSNDFCTKCSGENRELINNKCECINGYFLNQANKSCVQCNFNCVSCENSASNCTLCKSLYSASMIAPTCGCIGNYYLIQGACKICPSQCNGCKLDTKNVPICIACSSPFQSVKTNCKFTSGGYFAVENKDGTLEKQQCPQRCLVCTSSNQCDTCFIAQNRSTSLEIDCQCFKGFHDNNGTETDCQACPMECLECESSRVCTVCKKGLNRELNPYTMQCECKENYKEEYENSLDCVRCYTYEDGCFIECPDNTKIDEDLLQCMDLRFQEVGFNKLIYYFVTIAAVLAIAAFIYVIAKKIKSKIENQNKVHHTSLNVPKLRHKDSSDTMIL